MQRYTFHVISKRSRSTFFFLRDRTEDRSVTRRATRCSIYRDINLSPVPARCDGVFGF